MGWSYSLDLRKRVVGAFAAGDKTDEEVAELFQVGESCASPQVQPRRNH
jgi:transposase